MEPKNITPQVIKKTNRQMIYEHIYQKKKVSQQDIAYALRLSRPTVASNLVSLEQDGLIRKDGQILLERIGRKATAFSIVPAYRIGIGVELARKKVKIIAVDLYGAEMEHTVLSVSYEDSETYYKKVCENILDFARSLSVSEEQILGVGFAVQALVTSDGSAVFFGAILGCTGLRVEAFSRYLPYPCTFLHDADSAALSELWVRPELTDAVYLSLSRHLGGALIMERQIRTGKHGHSATFEHISVQPRGRLCYCGKRGCLETLCSLKALLGEERAEDFFRAVRSGAPEPEKRWRAYLRQLAAAIDHLHLVCDADFILGGHLAPYLTEADIDMIYREIRGRAPFEDPEDYILISKMPSDNIAIGAALFFIRPFLEKIEQEHTREQMG